MNVRWLLVVFVFLLPLCASAQQNDRVRVFGGYIDPSAKFSMSANAS
jgi:hypothetical protein